MAQYAAGCEACVGWRWMDMVRRQERELDALQENKEILARNGASPAGSDDPPALGARGIYHLPWVCNSRYDVWHIQYLIYQLSSARRIL